eukprot:CAMPEP_0119263560 /NCGR_PEP_ID=MMETSP1329-20130426/2926_1 /TAXON_ID=114041 /ORGANISM="Genus nov. species nov., Strain RCC1024" /LENGTH=289 /DNA_ID=CAMNT_0007263271 /DNA_START=72 /DNA_END=938 /DNA_ORIENTATION=-
MAARAVLWATTVAAVRGLRRRGRGGGYHSTDRYGRTPEAVTAALRERGAHIDADIITQLDETHDVPDNLDAVTLYNLFENVADDPKYAPQGGGVFGREVHVTDGEVTHVTYQLGAPEYDRGLLDDFNARRKEFNKRYEADRESLEDDQKAWRKVANRFWRYYGAEKQRLSGLGIETTHMHMVVYFKAGAIKCHTDGRMDDPRARRAIFLVRPSADVSASREKRLSFFLGMKKRQAGRSMFAPGLDVDTAYCFGQAGGNVLMTGRGSGGVAVIPAGGVESDERAMFMWHE